MLTFLLWATSAYPQSVHVEPCQPSDLLLCSWSSKWFRDTGRDLFVAGLGYKDFQTARADISDHLPVWAEFRIDGPNDD